MPDDTDTQTFNRRSLLQANRLLSRRRALKGSAAALASTVTLASSGTAAADPVREEVAVEMDDGVTIRGQLYYPSDGAGEKAEGQFPAIVTFEPYKTGTGDIFGPSLPRGTNQLVSEGYIRAEFEIRGTGRSGGRFRLGDEREELDFGELIYWLHDHDKTTGKIGTYGTSYRGLTQWMAAHGVDRIDRPEQPLKALFPIVTGVDGYRDVLFNGGMYDTVFASFWLGLVAGAPLAAGILAVDNVDTEDWLGIMESHATGALEGPLQRVVGSQIGEDAAYRDPEESREHTFPSVVSQDIPAFTIQGWHDIFQPGNTLPYTQLQNLWAGRDQFAPMDPGQPVTGKYQCVIGPYFHIGPYHDMPWAKMWFDRWLKGERNGIEKTGKPLHLFQTFGEKWVDARTWPLPRFGRRTVDTYYLDAGRTGSAPHSINDGALSIDQPTSTDGSDPLVWRLYNPCNQGTDEEGLFGLAPGTRCSTGNREFETGTLAYTTEPFDSARNIAGPVSASLFASTQGTNTSWVTVLADVAPDGSSTLISKGQLLGSFRELTDDRSWFVSGDGPGEEKLIRPYRGFTRAQESPVEPGVVERYDITMDPVFARIEAGHRLRLALRTTSSWATPFAKDLDDVGGVYLVQRNSEHKSFVNVPFVSGPIPASNTQWGECSTNCA